MHALGIFAHATSLNLIDSTVQGSDFNTTNPSKFGYVIAFSAAGTSFAPDLQGTDPLSLGTGEVVGVLSGVRWAEATGKPIDIAFQVSVHTARRIQELPDPNGAPIPVTFEIVNFAFDPLTRSWFVDFASDVNAAGLLPSLADLEVGSSQESRNPPKFAVSAAISPGAAEQNLCIAPAEGAPLVKAWSGSGGATPCVSAAAIDQNSAGGPTNLPEPGTWQLSLTLPLLLVAPALISRRPGFPSMDEADRGRGR